MSRYSDYDVYVDPDSGVLKNRFGITDAKLLEATEADLVASRSRELALTPLAGDFNLAHLKAIHRYLFGDIYEWAGQLRTVDISKGNNHFAHHGHIQSAAESIFQHLGNEKHLAGLDVRSFGTRAAYYLGELNALHPFREGNGRAQRELISHLAHKNGHYIAWEQVTQPVLLQASIASFHGDLSLLESVIQSILESVE